MSMANASERRQYSIIVVSPLIENIHAASPTAELRLDSNMTGMELTLLVQFNLEYTTAA